MISSSTAVYTSSAGGIRSSSRSTARSPAAASTATVTTVASGTCPPVSTRQTVPVVYEPKSKREPQRRCTVKYPAGSPVRIPTARTYAAQPAGASSAAAHTSGARDLRTNSACRATADTAAATAIPVGRVSPASTARPVAHGQRSRSTAYRAQAASAASSGSV